MVRNQDGRRVFCDEVGDEAHHLFPPATFTRSSSTTPKGILHDEERAHHMLECGDGMQLIRRTMNRTITQLGRTRKNDWDR